MSRRREKIELPSSVSGHFTILSREVIKVSSCMSPRLSESLSKLQWSTLEKSNLGYDKKDGSAEVPCDD